MTATISVILNLIQNQLGPDFRQDDGYGDDSVRRGRLHFALAYYPLCLIYPIIILFHPVCFFINIKFNNLMFDLTRCLI